MAAYGGDYGVGALVGGIGGLIQGYQQRRSETRARRRTRRAAAAARNQAEAASQAILASPEYAAGANFIRTFFGVRPQAPATPAGTNRVSAQTAPGPGQFNPFSMQPAPESPTSQAPFLDPLTENYLRAGNIVGEQSGLEGFAPAAAQTAGLGAFKFQQQLNLLPQLFQLGSAPYDIRNRLYNQYFGEQAALVGTGPFGASPMASGALGALVGGAAGGSFQFARQQNARPDTQSFLNSYYENQIDQSRIGYGGFGY